MAEIYVSTDALQRLRDHGLFHWGMYSDGWRPTATDLRNALEGMEAKDGKRFSSSWPEFKFRFKSGMCGEHGGYQKDVMLAADYFTDAEAMAAAVEEYMEWRAK